MGFLQKITLNFRAKLLISVDFRINLNIHVWLLSPCRFLFTSAVLNFAELIGLRPDLNNVRKILYFHENQLVYPVRKQKDRDFQNGYNQIISW